ncbi:MAG TPA: hypothetical protein VGI45_01565 [Terracidiphilus sp.]|jgi:DNA-binding NtrC family response regulator
MSAAIAIHTGSLSSPIHAFRDDLKLQTISQSASTVFIVDQDIYIRESLELFVSSQGWLPEACSSVPEFLARPRALVPSALILAFSSSNSNGLEIQKRIARDYAETPIIVVPTTKMSQQLCKPSRLEPLTFW